MQYQCCFGLLTLTSSALLLWVDVSGTSLMKRMRDSSSSSTIRGGMEMSGDGVWLQVPQSMQDVLMSINDKLRSLDTFSHTLRLARLDSSLDQLVRRMENIESKLARLDTKFDLRMGKVEEVVVSKDLKVEFSNEHLSRRMENLIERISNKAAYLDAKLDIKIERIMNKLDLLERDLHNSVDDILERLVKGEEKCISLEHETVKKEEKLDDLRAQVSEVLSFSRDGLMSTITQQLDHLGGEVEKVQVMLYQGGNRSEKCFREIQTSVVGIGERLLSMQQESNSKIDNLSVTVHSQVERGRIGADSYDMDRSVTQEQLENLTAVLGKALSVHEAKFKELDSDVEMYTRKVINGIQELWKTSDELKSDLSSTLEQGSKTREMVRQEFRRLHEQIEPLPKLEPKLSDISEDLDKKVFELSTTVDNSFATLLVAQNTFIDSCRRIQQEETHVYDILQQIVYEMRNRSITDIQKISTELRLQSTEINKSLTHMLTAVLLTGNITAMAVNDLLVQLKQKDQCVILKMDNLDLNAVESICHQISQSRNSKTSVFSQNSIAQNHSEGDTDILYDNDAIEQTSDSPLNLNVYEDYQLAEAYYPDNT